LAGNYSYTLINTKSFFLLTSQITSDVMSADKLCTSASLRHDSVYERNKIILNAAFSAESYYFFVYYMYMYIIIIIN
jgi:hypothetical protein